MYMKLTPKPFQPDALSSPYIPQQLIPIERVTCRHFFDVHVIKVRAISSL